MSELLDYIESNKFWSTYFKNSPNSMWISDLSGTMIKINKAFIEMWDLKEEDVIGKYNLFSDNILTELGISKNQLDPILKEGKSLKFQVGKYDPKMIDRIHFKTGRTRSLEVTISPIMNNNDLIIGALIQHFDLTEKKIYEENLNEIKFWLQKAQEVAHIGHWIWNYKTGKIFWSDEVYRICEVEKEHFIPSIEKIEKSIHPDDYNEYLIKKNSFFNDKKNAFMEYRIVLKNNKIKYVIIISEILLNNNGEIENIIGTVQDMTDYKKLQFQLIQSEKLSVAGQLAAGIAHEFNNLLAIIKVNLKLIDMSKNNELPDELKEICDTINNAVNRGADIVKNMIAFAKPAEPKKNYFFVEEILDDVLNLQKQQFQLENIYIEKEYSNKKKIYADRSQLQQVFLNMIINSRQAILDKGAGKIRITTEYKNGKIIIKIQDNGTGIDKQNLSKLFIPFFTTKTEKNLSGAGLGLTISLTIINNHGGNIFAQSEKNIGSVFTIEMPIQENMQVASNMTGSDFLKKNKDEGLLNILITDDEKDFVIPIARILEKCNCIVTNANTGKEALNLVKEKRFDIIFLDMYLPDFSGKVIYKKIREFDKETPVVFISGQVGFEKDLTIDSGVAAYIQKPFDISELLKILDDIKKNKKNSVV
ncbi:MAG TPA: response regulator [bacterium]|nr:response regulator [bacterium]